MYSRFAGAFALTLLTALPSSATTYPPVTFDQLVTRADVIFVGEVADVRAFRATTREGSVIKTRVVFRVLDPIWGTTSILEVFDFLGGELDGLELRVAEMPTFVVGHRRLVFASRGQSINPIIGFTYGLFQITRDDTGVDRVLTANGLPVARPEEIGTARAPEAPRAAAPMSLSVFRARISQRLAEAGRR